MNRDTIYMSGVLNQLSGVDFRVLDEITYLIRCRLKKDRRAAQYCAPGRAYLAGKIKVSIRTISRSLTKLHRLGIIKRVQRRRKDGVWQTNLYTVRKMGRWIFGRLHAWFRDHVYKHTGVPLRPSTAGQNCPANLPSKEVLTRFPALEKPPDKKKTPAEYFAEARKVLQG